VAQSIDDLIGGGDQIKPIDIPEPSLKIPLVQERTRGIPVLITESGEGAHRAYLGASWKGKCLEGPLWHAQCF
jgi:hypothetical protein